MSKTTKAWLFFIIAATAAITGYFMLASTNTQNKKGQDLQNSTRTPPPQAKKTQIDNPYPFTGEKGQTVAMENGVVKIDASVFIDTTARFYNVQMPSDKIIYFFVVKDQSGVIRAAANACQVCFALRKGFHQEGNEIVCNNCGNRYPLEKIATEKGGCNPGPINPNLKIVNGKINIIQAEIEQISDLF